MFKRYFPTLTLAALALGSASSRADVIMTADGLSATGVPMSFKADLAISGDTLTVELFNTSSQASLAPDGLLSSFFFDIVNSGNIRPVLSYVSAAGDVWLTSKNTTDTLQTSNANLKAVNANDNTWQYRALTATQNPFYGFGIGTVGNSGLAPNNFNGNITGAIDYSIYAGDITTSNLDNKQLVKGKATFVFNGVSGFTEADIKTSSLFGLGTAPDSLLGGTVPNTPSVDLHVNSVPTPGAALSGLVGLGLVGFGRIIRRRLCTNMADNA